MAFNHPGKIWSQTLPALNLNSANTDVGTFVNLPAKYALIRLIAFDASTSLTLATFSLRTASGGGGTGLIVAAALSGLVAATDTTQPAFAVTAYQTAASLFIRNITPQGGAATASFSLEVMDLT